MDPTDPRLNVNWSVNLSESETAEMTAYQIVQEYQRGALDLNDVYVWRDGMGDWIMLGECTELMDAIRQFQQTSSPAAYGNYPGHESQAPAAAHPASASPPP